MLSVAERVNEMDGLESVACQPWTSRLPKMAQPDLDYIGKAHLQYECRVLEKLAVTRMSANVIRCIKPKVCELQSLSVVTQHCSLRNHLEERSSQPLKSHKPKGSLPPLEESPNLSNFCTLKHE